MEKIVANTTNTLWLNEKMCTDMNTDETKAIEEEKHRFIRLYGGFSIFKWYLIILGSCFWIYTFYYFVSNWVVPRLPSCLLEPVHRPKLEFLPWVRFLCHKRYFFKSSFTSSDTQKMGEGIFVEGSGNADTFTRGIRISSAPRLPLSSYAKPSPRNSVVHFNVCRRNPRASSTESLPEFS